jgi:hypothetical protein
MAERGPLHNVQPLESSCERLTERDCAAAAALAYFVVANTAQLLMFKRERDFPTHLLEQISGQYTFEDAELHALAESTQCLVEPCAGLVVGDIVCNHN